MMLFRSLTIGLLGACVLLLLRLDLRSRHHVVEVIAPPAIEVAPRPVATATIVDVAAGIRGDAVLGLTALQSDEHVVSVDDRPVQGMLAAAAAIGTRADGTRGFIDIEIASGSGFRRRVLMLLH